MGEGRSRRDVAARSRGDGMRSDGIRVAVLMGGPSSEHEVSLQGGSNVIGALTGNPALAKHYRVRPVVIARNGTWRMPTRSRSSNRSSAVRMSSKAAGAGGLSKGILVRGNSMSSSGRTGAVSSTDGTELRFDPHATDGWKQFAGVWDGIAELQSWRADVVIPVLHGAFGEDGTVQACLRASGIPFVGSGMRGSALAFDKIRTKEILSVHGIATPKYLVAPTEALLRDRQEQVSAWGKALGFPLVLKNPCGGSTLEVRLARDEGEAMAVIDELASGCDALLIEQFVSGRELTAGVLEGVRTDPRQMVCRRLQSPSEARGESSKSAVTTGARSTDVGYIDGLSNDDASIVYEDGLLSLPIVEIRPRSGQFFDYHEKYSANGAEEFCPAELPAETTAKARELGRLVHRALGLKGISRTDLILSDDGTLYVLEVNTLPGMTSRGLVPQAAAVAGLSFQALIQSLVRTASLPE